MLEGTCYATVAPNEPITPDEPIAGQSEPSEASYARQGAYDPHELGRRGEDAAVKYLEDHGWEILERNWRWERGEVDVIARELAKPENCVTFIEVKTRRARRGAPEVPPEIAVDAAKQRRYLDSAERYLQMHPRFRLVRFDAIGITAWEDGEGAHLHHVPHAFEANR